MARQRASNTSSVLMSPTVWAGLPAVGGGVFDEIGTTGICLT